MASYLLQYANDTALISNGEDYCEILNHVTTRDEPILLFFSPIFLSGNSFIFNLFF